VGGAAGAPLGERHADGPGSHQVGDPNGGRESTRAGRAGDHVEEARALPDKPGTVRLEKGASEEGREGGEGAESLGGDRAVAGAESNQVAEPAGGGRDRGGRGQRGRAVAGGGCQSRGGSRCVGGRGGGLRRTTESKGQGEAVVAVAGRRAGERTRALRRRRGMKGRGGAGRASQNSRASMRATASVAVRLGQNIVSKSGGESAWVSRGKVATAKACGHRALAQGPRSVSGACAIQVACADTYGKAGQVEGHL
jgi:hypothetical protein